jgi:hypothetical protein
MYVLMIGLAAAFSLGFIYNMGWVLAGFQYSSFKQYLWLVVMLLLLAAIAAIIGMATARKRAMRIRRARIAGVCLFLTLLPLGWVLGLQLLTNLQKSAYFMVIALASLFFSIICFTGYKYFAGEFAKAVYHAFYAYEKTKEERA